MEAALQTPAEIAFAEELSALAAEDTDPRPQAWRLSPRAVRAYIMGDKRPSGLQLSSKYIGDVRLIELAIATLITDRALLLIGVPGTAKSWLAEHLTAAISGDSTLLIQGTAGTTEENIRYNWNYARLLSEGPTEAALVPSPLMRGMQAGKIVRIEELTRMPSEIQDTLISILSEKILPVPELQMSITAQRGFNLIATANARDKGVHELSSALKRRFNAVRMPLPESLEREVEIVQMRVHQQKAALQIPAQDPSEMDIERIVTIFRELREGKTLDGRHKLKQPSSTLSTAEIISVLNSGLSMAAYFGTGDLQAKDWVSGLPYALVKDPQKDLPAWQEYIEIIIKKRKGWEDIYQELHQEV
ncbi:MAG: AAA family ATPase [Bernardetiaceae bacterium]